MSKSSSQKDNKITLSLGPLIPFHGLGLSGRRKIAFAIGFPPEVDAGTHEKICSIIRRLNGVSVVVDNQNLRAAIVVSKPQSNTAKVRRNVGRQLALLDYVDHVKNG
ncbi:MAG TPA: hypothetical protein VF597_02515 [Candidatus Saccharimonadales bacterium]|jgi:hypothetical protein